MVLVHAIPKLFPQQEVYDENLKMSKVPAAKPVVIEEGSDDIVTILMVVGVSVAAYFLWEKFEGNKDKSPPDQGPRTYPLDPLSPAQSPVSSPTPFRKLLPPQKKKPPTVVSKTKDLQGPYSAPGVIYCAQGNIGLDDNYKPFMNNLNPPYVVQSAGACVPEASISPDHYNHPGVAYVGQWIDHQWQGKFVDPGNLCSSLPTQGGAPGTGCDTKHIPYPWPKGVSVTPEFSRKKYKK